MKPQIKFPIQKPNSHCRIVIPQGYLNCYNKLSYSNEYSDLHYKVTAVKKGMYSQNVNK